MFQFSIGLIVALVACLCTFLSYKNSFLFRRQILNYCTCFGMFCVSFVMVLVSTAIYVEDDQGGLVVKKFGSSLVDGHIVAANGEKGPQANVLTPGWHFWYWPWIYNLEPVENITIEQGFCGVVSALDGKTLPEGSIYAPVWDDALEMLDATKFLNGDGFEGPQLTLLKPRQYRYNPRLFKIEPHKLLNVGVGEVAVVKSNDGPIYDGEELEVINGQKMVPEGFKGIWNKALTPGQYYIHPDAFEVTTVVTTNRVYSYTSKSTLSSTDRPEHDNSIEVRTKDGFEFPVDVRASVKITADNAPYVVALLGDPDLDKDNDGFDRLETIVVLPAVRAIFRNTAEEKGGLEYVNTRSSIEKDASEQFASKLKEFRIETDGLYVANIGLSQTDEGKNLLKTQTDKEVALQAQETWAEKKKEEDARAESVRAATEADKEEDKVTAEVAVEVAANKAEETIKLAEGEAKAALAKIEAVGGYENYVLLQMIEHGFDSWDGKFPTTLVTGDGKIDTAILSKMLGDLSKND